MDGRSKVGAALWLIRPVYVVLELVVAAATTGTYSLVDDTVSDLGAITCSASFCSPQHGLMDGTFLGVGLLLVLGAVLLAQSTGALVALFLVVAGLSTIATGLAPVDQDATLHTWAAGPLFVCQPVALVLLAVRLRPMHPRLARALLVTGLVSAAAAVGFLVAGGGAGVLERLALWPVIFALAAAAAVLVRTPPGPSRSPHVPA